MSNSTSKLTTATSDDGSKGAHLHHSDSINRFLTDRDQRPPIGFGSVQTQGEAEAAGKARMSENLRAFGVCFGDAGISPAAKSKQEEK